MDLQPVDLNKIKDLVLRDPVALMKWDLVADRLLTSAIDSLRIKKLIYQEGEYQEAVLSTLQLRFKRDRGLTPDLIQVLREIHLNHLADEIHTHVNLPLLHLARENSRPSSKNKNSTTEQPEFVSLFLKDFERIRDLGRGGYGIVIEAKKKFDGKLYAVKRVLLRKSKESDHRVMREVVALTELDHRNIVRYFNSWSEESPIGWVAKNDALWSENESASATTTASDGASFSVEFVGSNYGEEPQMLSYETKKLTQTQTQSTNSDSPEESDTNEPGHEVHLYIQQELCQKTLGQWLQVFDKERQILPILDIFSQIARGVAYVHSKGYMHRDLQPTNIFLSDVDPPDDDELIERPSGVIVKIGDFGLARALDPNISSDKVVPGLAKSINASYTSSLGTTFYMSPELIDHQPYDYKVDIYALGVILYEMLVPFATEMERAQKLKELRNESRHDSILSGLQSDQSDESDWIKKMLSRNWSQRPEAREIKLWLTTKTALLRNM